MTVLDHAALALPLSAAMREGSRVQHEEAENSTFMAELLDGRINPEGYAVYLRALREVYATMEAAVRGRLDDPAVAAVHDPALERLAALDADLAHWDPDGPRPSGSQAAAAYCARIDAAAARDTVLVAHHYTRYLGDLSGGQAIGRILDRAFDLDGAGVAFYAFPEIPKPKPYKDAYRARLDALDLGAEDKGRVVEEVQVAFRLNQDLFAELGRDIDLYRR